MCHRLLDDSFAMDYVNIRDVHELNFHFLEAFCSADGYYLPVSLEHIYVYFYLQWVQCSIWYERDLIVTAMQLNQIIHTFQIRM